MYNGNPNLRFHNEAIEYTKKMQQELIHCMEDIIYFAENYCKIVTIDEGLKLIKLWPFQKRILKTYVKPPNKKRNVIYKSPRQSGKCCTGDTFIKIKNKKTNEVLEISMEDFHNLTKRQSGKG